MWFLLTISCMSKAFTHTSLHYVSKGESQSRTLHRPWKFIDHVKKNEYLQVLRTVTDHDEKRTSAKMYSRKDSLASFSLEILAKWGYSFAAKVRFGILVASERGSGLCIENCTSLTRACQLKFWALCTVFYVSYKYNQLKSFYLRFWSLKHAWCLHSFWCPRQVPLSEKTLLRPILQQRVFAELAGDLQVMLGCLNGPWCLSNFSPLERCTKAGRFSQAMIGQLCARCLADAWGWQEQLLLTQWAAMLGPREELLGFAKSYCFPKNLLMRWW